MDKVNNKQKTFLEKIREFRLLDDDFMSKVFEDDYGWMKCIIKYWQIRHDILRKIRRSGSHV